MQADIGQSHLASGAVPPSIESSLDHVNPAVGDVDQARRCADLRLEDSELLKVWTARPNHVFKIASGTSNAQNNQAREDEFHMKAELPRVQLAVFVLVSPCSREKSAV